jgi:hypothetical protein
VITPQRPDALYTADDRADKQISATGASLKDWAPESWREREVGGCTHVVKIQLSRIA